MAFLEESYKYMKKNQFFFGGGSGNLLEFNLKLLLK